MKDLAVEAGASLFHFSRLFQAYVGETPFSYVRRTRIWASCNLLLQLNKSVTEVSAEVGFDTPSSFNKAFKELTSINPTEFRNLGKAERDELLYTLRIGNIFKEVPMNLSENPILVERDDVNYLYLEKRGLCQEIATGTWAEMFAKFGQDLPLNEKSEFLGISMMDLDDENGTIMVYQAGLTVEPKALKIPEGLKLHVVEGGKYAKFLLTGPYPNVWPAFKKIFQDLDKHNLRLRAGPCIENYLNDPAVTAPENLLTELLLPVE